MISTTRSILSRVVGCVLALAVTAVAFAGEPVEFRLTDGSRFKGQTGDHVRVTILEQGIEVTLTGWLAKAAKWYITLETELAGEIRQKTIFKGDILAMEGIEPDEQLEQQASLKRRDRATPSPGKGDRTVQSPDQPGVFVLPLKGSVGLYFRHQEIEAIAREADKYGRGQIIVLLIDSPGGAVTETEQIHETLMKVKQRHRLVGWVKEAISAACATVLHCDEIYFMTEGSAGAMTAYAGQQAWKDEELAEWLRRAGDWAEAGGRSRYIAEAMIHAPKMLSYDRDPVTGKVTFYPDLSGKHVLSKDDENLVFTATQAVDCGFADGIADTEEQLAELLDLPKWHEISDYGREIAEEWEETVDLAQEEIPLLLERLGYLGTGSGDPIVILGKRIQILEDLIRWHGRCPNFTRGRIPPKDNLERQIAELRKQIADLKKARRY